MNNAFYLILLNVIFKIPSLVAIIILERFSGVTTSAKLRVHFKVLQPTTTIVQDIQWPT